MTRTVNCLVEDGYVVPPPPRHRRPPGRWSTSPRQGREILLADRRRRDAWLAQRLRELTPDERALLREAAPLIERLRLLTRAS